MSVKIISSERISNHRYFTARKDAYQLASGKIVDPYFVVEMPPSATAMAITENNEVILILQYRHPVGETLLELPGGFIEKDEDKTVAIRRELLEETGYEFNEVFHLGNTAANPGVLNNYTDLFLAVGGKKIQLQHLDDNEEIEIVLKPLEEVRLLLNQCQFKQSMQALCLFYGFSKLDNI